MYRLLLLALVFSFNSFAQSDTTYQGLLWKISGKGLDEPSYLYGTMHVSNRVAFHLSETFFDAIDNADIIALETNPEHWVIDLTTSPLHQDYYNNYNNRSPSSMPLYESFMPTEVHQEDWEYYLSRDQDLLNSLLYRVNMFEQDFAENTFLDLFIFQAGKKGGKEIVALEDYQESFRFVLRSSRRDEDAVRISDRQARELLGDYSSWQGLLEDAYRRGDLDLMHSVSTALNPGKYFQRFMLDERNIIMADGMDSLMQAGKVLFTGVGASHLPGDMGVINLLREMGYTVEPEERAITETSIERKEQIDDVIFVTEAQTFVSDDGFITTSVPGVLTKLQGNPFQEYVYPDMANGGVYSIRRIPTYAPIDGRDENYYYDRIENILFENIPGKILSKDSIQISGFPALDIKNETKLGNAQRYQIVFTPLEVIIFKVGGHKEFAKSELPENFFNSIQLNATPQPELYSPDFAGFEVLLPGSIQIEQYEGNFDNPHATFWAQSYDNGDYYATSLRQYHDFEYIEEDHFELKHMIRHFADEKEYDIDTVYIVEGTPHDYSRFEISGEDDVKLYGEVHIQGPKYVMLLTDGNDEAKRSRFFSSFQFKDWKYEDTFVEYTDTTFFITMKAPKDFNNFESLLDDIYGGGYYGYGYGSDEDRSFLGTEDSKSITYHPTGEQLEMEIRVLPKYASVESLDEFWKGFSFAQSMRSTYQSASTGAPDILGLDVISDTILYTIEEDDYLSQAREYVLGDTLTNRAIRVKYILENGALYSLRACVDTLGYTSEFIETAFASFKPSSDTIIGLPITMNKAEMFFDALDSRDSVQVYEASNSVSIVDFEDDDAEEIIEIVNEYFQEGFKRTARLSLLSKLSEMEGDEEHVEFLKDLYYERLDSSAYQFEILNTLVNFDTDEGTKAFKELILDEPPFTNNTYSYSRPFYAFSDSLELAAQLFPDLLALSDFIEYRSNIYSLLARLVDSSYIDRSAYESKFETLLLFAKVELKKQQAADEQRSNVYSYGSTGSSTLSTYTNLLAPYSEDPGVQEHYKNLLKIRTKRVLANLLVDVDPYTQVPDSTWNFLAKDGKAFYIIYPYLMENDKMDVLDEEYRTREAIAECILVNRQYSRYDTISFIRSEKIQVKEGDAEVFFFRAQREDEKLWRFLYLVVEDEEEMTTDYLLSREVESYDETVDDIDEIIEDALDSIELHGRERVVNRSSYPGYYF